MFLKANVSLDFETQPELNVSVGVDDSEIAGSPDETATLGIKITDVVGGADLSINEVNPDNLNFDGQELTVVGSISAEVTNQGTGDLKQPFEVLFFEDINGNQVYDVDLDRVLGNTTINETFLAGETKTIIANLNGKVSFAEIPIGAFVDSRNAITELNEDNNVAFSNYDCLIKPTGEFNPIVEWNKNTFSVLPSSNQVMMTPAVIDLNNDDIPDVIFSTFIRGNYTTNGILRAISGANGNELWTVTNPSYELRGAAGVAVGDIDNDGQPEILATAESGDALIAFEHDGTFKWRSPSVWGGIGSGSASIADLDGDGTPEIIIGGTALDNQGSILWEGNSVGGIGRGGTLSVVADLDLDGSPEVVAGRSAYHADGSLYWNASISDGFPAIGNFDDDANPEIVVVSNGKVYLLEHTGEVQWGGISIPGGGRGGAPTIADVDGDGEPEIGVAGGSKYVVFEADGSVKWTSETRDQSSNVTGSSVFDFNGDGKAEIVYGDELYLRIYNGSDGEILYQLPKGSGTTYELPLIVDVDADGNAEIVAVANNYAFGDQTGIFVIGDLNDTWVSTRQIWNQHSYHITNINDDGSIPITEENSWQSHNTYRLNLQTEFNPLAAPDLTASYLRTEEISGKTHIKARIGNGGSIFVSAGVNVAFYDGDPRTGGVLLGTTQTTKKLEIGDFEDVILEVDSTVLENIWVVADDDGTGSGQVNECNENNNFFSAVPNQPPIISSTPVVEATVNEEYTYQIIASDPEGLDLSYELVNSPTGMTIDADTGLITWNPAFGQEGFNTIKVKASDPQGLGAIQTYGLNVATANQAPILKNNPPAIASVGQTYRFDLNVTDPDGDEILYSLVNAPEGMTVDELGRIRWNPTVADVGTQRVEFQIQDIKGAGFIAGYNLQVIEDTTEPVVTLVVDRALVDIGDSVIATVTATDNVEVETVSLTLNGNPVTLDENGIASIEFSQFGLFDLVATATDTSGNSGDTSLQVEVIDSSDTQAPIVDIISPTEEEDIYTLADIVGTVEDDNLVNYTITATPFNGGAITVITTGDTTITNGVLDQFDASVLQNDSYFLELTATDAGGNSSSDTVLVDVTGNAKLGNYTLSFEDLSIPVTGIPITLIRTYDSFNANQTDDFGFGWRMEIRDTNLRTSVGESGFEDIGLYNPYYFGAKVYVTTPGGQREGFTFEPRLAGLRGRLLRIWEPHFVPDDGVTSELTVENTDLFFDGNGEFLAFGSSIPYNPISEDFGGGFTLTTKEGISYEIDGETGDTERISDRNDNSLTFTDAGIFSSTGQEITFERDVQGRITSEIDPMGDRIEYDYDVSGDLVSVTDRDDNVTEFEYLTDTPHYLSEVIDPLGNTGARSEYDENGRLSQLIDVNGEAVTLEYDVNNSVQTVKDIFGNPTTYVYDDRGNILTEIDPVGQRIDRTYDENDNELIVTVITDESGAEGWMTSFTYDDKRNVLSETDSQGNTTFFTYGAFSQLTSQTDQLGNTTTYDYDNSGNLLQIEDSAGKVTKMNYDSGGNLLALTDSEEQTTTFEYDSSGNVTKTIDALGNETVTTYDANGRQLTETRKLTTSEGVKDVVTEWVYDDEGNLKSITDAENQTTSYEYDGNDNKTAIIDALGRRTEFRYDNRGQLIETIYPDSTPLDLTDNPRTIQLYDREGRSRVTIDEAGFATHFVYDEVDRLTTTIHPDAIDTLADLVVALAPGETLATIDWTEVIYPDAAPAFLDDNSRQTTIYTQDGQILAEIDELGNRTDFIYNDLRQLVETKNPELADTPGIRYSSTFIYDDAGRRISETDANGRTTEFVYDDLGRLVETKFADGSSIITEYDTIGRRIAEIDQEGKRTDFEYDDLGRLTKVIQSSPTDGEERPETIYGYNESGNLISQTDAEGRTTIYEYDLVGRRIQRTLPESQSEFMTYDLVGNLETRTDFNNFTTTFEYDERDRLTAEIADSTHPSLTLDNATARLDYEYNIRSNRTDALVTNNSGTVIHSDFYAYDERNRLTSKETPFGTLQYTYDDASNLLSVRSNNVDGVDLEYEYDEYNRLQTVIDSNAQLNGIQHTYTYDPVGNLASLTYGNGVVHNWSYNNLNRLTDLTITNSAGDILQSYAYTLSPAGHRTQVVEADGRTVNYTYDNLYRLTQESISNDPQGINGQTNWTYDLVGNRLTQVSNIPGVSNQTPDYDDNDRLESDTYDDNGNTLADATAGFTDTYDFKDRLIQRTTNDGTEIAIIYDADGNRVEKTVDGESVNYLVDTNNLTGYAQVYEELSDDGSGNLTPETVYTYGLDLINQNQLIITPDSEEWATHYYLYDGLGSVRDLVDVNEIITDSYLYDAFGNILNSSGNTDNNYLFTGEQFDDDLGMYFLRARYLNPQTGRFHNMDTFEGFNLEPLSLHKYLYANVNPISNIDPSGNFSLPEIQVVVTLTGFNLKGLYRYYLGSGIGGIGTGISKISQAHVARYFNLRGVRTFAYGAPRPDDLFSNFSNNELEFEVLTYYFSSAIKLGINGYVLERIGGRLRESFGKVKGKLKLDFNLANKTANTLANFVGNKILRNESPVPTSASVSLGGLIDTLTEIGYILDDPSRIVDNFAEGIANPYSYAAMVADYVFLLTQLDNNEEDEE